MIGSTKVNKGSSAVRVFPQEGEWLIGCGAGYYNYPTTKEEAIERAVTLAQARANEHSHAVEVEIHDEVGTVVAVLNVEPSAPTPVASEGVERKGEMPAALTSLQMLGQFLRAPWPRT